MNSPVLSNRLLNSPPPSSVVQSPRPLIPGMGPIPPTGPNPSISPIPSMGPGQSMGSIPISSGGLSGQGMMTMYNMGMNALPMGLNPMSMMYPGHPMIGYPMYPVLPFAGSPSLPNSAKTVTQLSRPHYAPAPEEAKWIRNGVAEIGINLGSDEDGVLLESLLFKAATLFIRHITQETYNNCTHAQEKESQLERTLRVILPLHIADTCYKVDAFDFLTDKGMYLDAPEEQTSL
eukprot:TRINITY_DN13330_c0_g1_i1.p1 TRINITY_DN13330_c0_g1~~TRINITY_DN13330_c0_g1_i1.p1  ORF type:complete len:272 (+),score=34.70 TRINITY_DN13330_c0_g1_i1:120-818(+)